MVKIFRFKSLEAESLTGGAGSFTTLNASNSVGVANGSLANLSVRFANDTDTGFYLRGVNTLCFVNGGNNRFDITSSQFRFAVGTVFGWTFNDLSGSLDLELHRDTSDTLAQRRGAQPQTFRLYGQITGSDVSATGNYERGFMRWSAAGGVFQIGTEAGSGGGQARTIDFSVGATNLLSIRSNEVRTVALTNYVSATGSVAQVGLGQFGFVAGGANNAGGILFYNGNGGGVDTRLGLDASNVLAIKSGTAAQSFRIYNTTIWERANFRWASNEFIIDAEAGGTGQLRGIKLGSATSSLLGFYGVTPVDQPALTADLLDSLQELGLVASGSGDTPLNLSGGTLTAGNLVLTDNTGSETATFDAQSKLTANRTYDLPNASGTIALAADVFDFDYSTTNSSATGGSGTWTWTVPATAKFLHLWIVSGGGGGGSGRRGAAGTNRTGGAGGHSGAITETWCKKSNLSNTLTITIGAGGAGGAAQTVDNTNGNNGTNGGISSVSSLNSLTMSVQATSGGVMRGGVEGTSTPSVGGNFSVGALYTADTGAAGSSGTGGARQNNSAAPNHLQGGSGGGGINSSNVASGGGFNFNGTVSNVFGTAQGGGGGASGGGNGSSAVANGAIVGGSGSGGGANLTGAGGNGGNGYRGGGGGGGGASVNGNNSGAGGNGGNGFVRITVFY